MGPPPIERQMSPPPYRPTRRRTTAPSNKASVSPSPKWDAESAQARPERYFAIGFGDARDPEEASASVPAEMHLRGASASDQPDDRRLPLRPAKEQHGAVRPAGVPQIVSV